MNIWSVIPLIACLAYIALLIRTLPSVERRADRLFAFYLAIATTWSFISFMLHLNAFPQQALLWNKLQIIALVWTLITYYHFIRAYIRKPAGVAVYLGYALVLVLAVLSFSGHIVQYAYVIDGVLYHNLGISNYFISAFSLTFVGLGVYLLVRRYLDYTNPVERNRTAYLIAGWSLLMLLGYSNLITTLSGISLDQIGNLANALKIAYAIRRRHPLDIKLVARKGLAYLSLTIFFTYLYLMLLFISQTLFHSLTRSGSLAIAAVFTLLVTVLFNPLNNFVQKWIDHIFYLETYDYRQTLPDLSKRVSNILDLGELARSILGPLVKTMHIKQAALLLPEVESTKFNTRFVEQTIEEEPFTRLKFANDSPIVNWLGSEGKPLRRELIDFIPQFKGLWEVERIALNALKVEVLCPIMSKGKLIGILALGNKQSDSTYSDEEVDLLMTTAKEAATALENARVFDIIKKEQLQVEQLLAQLALVREEELKGASTDINNNIAQWLLGNSYLAQISRQVLSGDNIDTARHELTNTESIFNKSLKALRRVVAGRNQSTLGKMGLTHALWQSLEDLQADGLDCKFSEVGTPVPLPPNVQIAVYRIVQEALANIRKHANASQVDLRLQFKEDRLVVDIRDNGSGFDPSQTLDSNISAGHRGLQGMKQEAEMLGGNIKIRSVAGKGTTIILSLPVVEPQIEKK